MAFWGGGGNGGVSVLAKLGSHFGRQRTRASCWSRSTMLSGSSGGGGGGGGGSNGGGDSERRRGRRYDDGRTGLGRRAGGRGPGSDIGLAIWQSVRDG